MERNTLASSVPAPLISHQCLLLAEPVWIPDDIGAWETHATVPHPNHNDHNREVEKANQRTNSPRPVHYPSLPYHLFLTAQFQSHDIVKLSPEHS